MNLYDLIKDIFEEQGYTIPFNKKGIDKEKVIRAISSEKIGAELSTYLGYATKGKASAFLRKVFYDKIGCERYTTFLLAKRGLKICSSCRVVKPLSDYKVNLSRPIGAKPKCTKCQQQVYDTFEYKLGRKESRLKCTVEQIAASKAYMAKYRLTNRYKILENQKEYNIHHKEEKRLYDKNRYLNNRAYYLAKGAKYRAAKLRASPEWANQKLIYKIYDNRPEGYHVDHIVPLQGKLVCGLHVESNLQYLHASENLSKGNKFNV